MFRVRTNLDLIRRIISIWGRHDTKFRHHTVDEVVNNAWFQRLIFVYCPKQCRIWPPLKLALKQNGPSASCALNDTICCPDTSRLFQIETSIIHCDLAATVFYCSVWGQTTLVRCDDKCENGQRVVGKYWEFLWCHDMCEDLFHLFPREPISSFIRGKILLPPTSCRRERIGWKTYNWYGA